jgi:hypothetical protein
VFRILIQDQVVECDTPDDVAALIRAFTVKPVKPKTTKPRKATKVTKRTKEQELAYEETFFSGNDALKFETVVKLRRDNERIPNKIKNWFGKYATYWILETLVLSEKFLAVEDVASHLGAKGSGKGIITYTQNAQKLAKTLGIPWSECLERKKEGGKTYWKAGSRTKELMEKYKEKYIVVQSM